MAEYTDYFLDYDHLLFDTDQFIAWMGQNFANLGYRKDFAQTVDVHYDDSPDQVREYRFEEHIRYATGKSWKEISPQLAEAARDRSVDFCFPDSHPFLAHLTELDVKVHIVTYGVKAFQLFKVSLCSDLHSRPWKTHIVELGQSKADFLAGEFPEIARGVLYDDKRQGALPAGWGNVLVDRKAEKAYEITENGLMIMNSLRIP